MPPHVAILGYPEAPSGGHKPFPLEGAKKSRIVSCGEFETLHTDEQSFHPRTLSLEASVSFPDYPE